ncbi:MAG TPA: GtrA family protein [Burkholderiales bacterium]|nr:GtrA family protein [Burkholderiales bacterium]
MIRQPLAFGTLRELAGEGGRYTVASALALAVDFGSYAFLIRAAGANYLAAAPVGFLLGLATIYALSVRWVFGVRRLQDSRIELAVFGGIGLAGLGLNQVVVYAGVEWLSLSYWWAKLVSAALVFGFNFSARKLLLFTRR